MVQNIYKKALDWQDRKKAKTIDISMDRLQLLNKEVSIDKNDILNILYDSNETISYSIDFLNRKNKNWDYKITSKDINDSYQKIYPELERIWFLNSTNNNIINKSKTASWINSQFVIASDNTTFLQEFDEASLWEDLFINGVADDSDYDLQVDIQNLWDLLFESFIAPVETVFYKMPPINKWSSSNSNNISNDNQQLIDILQNAIIQSANINTWVITNWWWQTQTTQSTTNQNTNSVPKSTTLNDSSLQNFVQDNSLSQKSTNQVEGIQWDICSEWVSEWQISSEETDTIDQDELENYLAQTQQQIDNYNNIYPTTIPNISNNPALIWMTSNEANQFIENYISDLFDVESTESCLNSCNSLPIDDRAICQIQCLCFSMVWPNNPDIRVQSMNEMLKLRFCMVPAESTAIPRWRNIYSLDDILNRIYSNMYNLINNWEMTKYQKTKEYIDNPIADLKFDKIISFQMNLNIKPIFNNKSAIAKKDQKETYIQKLEKATGKEQNLGVDYNKYLVIQDTAKNKAYKQYWSDFENYQENYKKELEKLESRKDNPTATNIKTASLSSIMADEKSKSLTTIAEFLSQNLKFREQTEKEIQNLNNIIFFLQSKL